MPIPTIGEDIPLALVMTDFGQLEDKWLNRFFIISHMVSSTHVNYSSTMSSKKKED